MWNDGDSKDGGRVPAALVSALIGLAALAWFALRTGPKPSRAAYPCQRAALSTSWTFLFMPLVIWVPRHVRGKSRGAVVAAVVAVAVVGLALALQNGLIFGAAQRGGWDKEAWLSEVSARAPRPLMPGRVVRVTNDRATDWDFETGWYGDHVDQGVVTSMVEEGLTTLTGTSSVRDAWVVLIPDFRPGQKLAIKVNLNNTRSERPGNAIDAIIEPVNALLGGLIDYGFRPSDITVYDVTHGLHDGRMPERLSGRCAYEGVNFEAYLGSDRPFSGEVVTFHPPRRTPITDRPLARVLVEADYLINIPIAKAHDFAGMSLSFKNHFGSIDRCDRLHPYAWPRENAYTPDYSPLVDLYANENIGGKTVLTLCDALFGSCEHLWSAPGAWPTCLGSPNAIVLSTDPVALDCVVGDMLREQGAVPETGFDYLRLAARAGMGVYDRADSDGTYAAIDLISVERP